MYSSAPHLLIVGRLMMLIASVDREYQGQGIGRKLIAKTQEKLGSKCKIVLLSAPAVSKYYPALGFSQHDSAWVLAGDVRVVVE